MSRKATDPETGLTPKQEAFCLVLAKTGNASEAYRQAYDASRMKPETITRKAAELAANGNIRARLASLRSDARKQSGITLADHLRDLRTLREEARGAMQISAAVSAEVARGKVSGLYDSKDEDSAAPAPVAVTINVVDGRKPA